MTEEQKSTVVFKRYPSFEESSKQLADSLVCSVEEAQLIRLKMLCEIAEMFSNNKQ